jgi:ketosteroid isomerase-like protein
MLSEDARCRAFERETSLMSEQNVQTVRGLYDAFNRGDLETLEKGFSRDLNWNEAENSLYSGGNPYRSFGAVREGVFAPTNAEFDEFRCDIDQLLDAGDYVICTGRYRGRCRETGRMLGTQFCHIVHIDPDGAIDRLQEYADTLDEAQVTGRIQEVREMKIPHPAI